MASKMQQQTRMGAVFDHLCPLGFSKSLIRKKVNLLLKVYGNEGWVFLEEDAYKLLIEAILEEQDKLPLKDCSMEIGAASTSSQQLNQTVVIEHACIKTESDKEPVSQSVVMEAEMGGRRWEDLPEDILVSIFTEGLRAEELEFVVPKVCSSWRRASRHPLCQRVIDPYDSDDSDSLEMRLRLRLSLDRFLAHIEKFREIDKIRDIEHMRKHEEMRSKNAVVERFSRVLMSPKILCPQRRCCGSSRNNCIQCLQFSH